MELPEPPLTLVGVRVHARLVELVVTVRLTVPVKPPTPCTVIVLMAEIPVFTVAEVGLAVKVKSVTLTVAIALCDRDPLAPVTVTV